MIRRDVKLARDRPSDILIFDTVANRPLPDNRRVPGSKGVPVIAGGPTDSLLGIVPPPLRAPVISLFVSQTPVPFPARPRKEDLIFQLEPPAHSRPGGKAFQVYSFHALDLGLFFRP